MTTYWEGYMKLVYEKIRNRMKVRSYPAYLTESIDGFGAKNLSANFYRWDCLPPIGVTIGVRAQQGTVLLISKATKK